ncbi:MAG: M3 family oligoendopeptidase [Deltaproteobacteria bacterium]|nr:M3 family oligoendopeptidase [Deltaproteobacteria bacterium]
MIYKHPMTTYSAQGVRWDLSDLFSAHDDPRIDETLNACSTRAEAFAGRFRGRITISGGPSSEELLEAISELEQIEEMLSRVGTYAGLLYAADSSSPEYQDLEQSVEQRVTTVRNLLLFFELEWLELPEEAARRLADDPVLKAYSHYLKTLRRFRPHRLTEAEEKIINEKDNTGRNAFARLFSETTSSLVFALEQDGQKQELTLSEVLALLYQPDRRVRERAWSTLFNELSGHGQTLAFIYDTLLQDHLTTDRLRHYPDPMRERHLANEIDPEAVETMMSVTEANYGIAREYFRLKARLLRLPRLALFDQYAPVGKKSTAFSFSRAREVIMEAFGAFTPIFRSIADEFFSRNWIDAEIRKGKRGGAFCASPSPKIHPYILCNYTDSVRDALTVAHELGHGLHGSLSRGQSFLNYDTPLTTAETASVFGEMLVFDYLLDRQTDPEAEMGLVAGMIEDVAATVFRQNVLTRFEQAVFSRRKEGRLTPQTIGDLWIEANEKYYGDAVDIDNEYRWGWSYIPHFIHSRFYCYSYVFGELLVLSLYRMYREEGKGFVPKYLILLEAGGSVSPEVLLRPLNVNLHAPEFWQKGFDEISGLVARLKKLVDTAGGADL